MFYNPQLLEDFLIQLLPKQHDMHGRVEGHVGCSIVSILLGGEGWDGG